MFFFFFYLYFCGLNNYLFLLRFLCLSPDSTSFSSNLSPFLFLTLSMRSFATLGAFTETFSPYSSSSSSVLGTKNGSFSIFFQEWKTSWAVAAPLYFLFFILFYFYYFYFLFFCIYFLFFFYFFLFSFFYFFTLLLPPVLHKIQNSQQQAKVLSNQKWRSHI